MFDRLTRYYTVPEVIRAMGIETTNALDWRVGTLMSNWYDGVVGERSNSGLRPKTNGAGGSHQFRHYSEELVPKIQSFVRLCSFELARQGELSLYERSDFDLRRTDRRVIVEGFE